MEIPNSEVRETKGSRRFTNKYKLEILKKAENCERGEIGEFLRKEGLYSAALSRWKKEYAEGKLKGSEKKRGRKKKQVNPLKIKVKELEKEKEKLEKKLKRAEKIIEFQKKIAELMESEE